MNKYGLAARAMLAALVSNGLDASSASAQVPVAAAESAFLAENEMAMSAMMQGMSIKPTGNIDRDFAVMMISHHQGAIDMARAELRFGKAEQLRRIAQEIVVNQIDEIAAMRLAAGLTPDTHVTGTAP